MAENLKITVFEDSLRRLFDGHMPDAEFVGRACVAPLPGGMLARMEFVTAGHADKYEALRVKILNRRTGPVDETIIRFSDLFGPRPMSAGKSALVIPHIYAGLMKSDGQYLPDWYGYRLTDEDVAMLRDSVMAYVSLFGENPVPVQDKAENEPSYVLIEISDMAADIDIYLMPDLKSAQDRMFELARKNWEGNGCVLDYGIPFDEVMKTALAEPAGFVNDEFTLGKYAGWSAYHGPDATDSAWNIYSMPTSETSGKITPVTG